MDITWQFSKGIPAHDYAALSARNVSGAAATHISAASCKLFPPDHAYVHDVAALRQSNDNCSGETAPAGPDDDEVRGGGWNSVTL